MLNNQLNNRILDDLLNKTHILRIPLVWLSLSFPLLKDFFLLLISLIYLFLAFFINFFSFSESLITLLSSLFNKILNKYLNQQFLILWLDI